MTPPPKKIILAASILAADGLNLERDLAACQKTGRVQWVHVDVMDGHFTPNISFGPEIVAQIARRCSFFIDVHLMVTRPMQWIEPFAVNGANSITVHLEAEDSAKKC